MVKNASTDQESVLNGTMVQVAKVPLQRKRKRNVVVAVVVRKVNKGASFNKVHRA